MVRRAPRSTRKAPRFPYTTLFRPGLDSDPSVAVVTLATAHPAKFPDAVERASGVRPPLPARLGNLFDREERYEKLPGDYDAVKAYILAEAARGRSEEHTSELQSLMRISYAVFCLKHKKRTISV